MKISILIPTYNYDCSRLVRQLQLQLPEDGELIVGDDCSTDRDIILKNSDATILPGCRFFQSDHNLGRAAIRNALAREAKGDWLLFIDADAEVRSQSFISDYLAATEVETVNGQCSMVNGQCSMVNGQCSMLNAQCSMVNGQCSTVNVVCGGTGNLPQCPRPAARLRYDYEVAAEKRLTLEHRRRFPYAQFTTFNFLIRRDLFLSIGFDENCKTYGHEDTRFGLALKQRGIEILHIDNKLTHLGLEDAEVYLQKTETALRSLASMDLQQRQHVRVSALALRLRHWHLQGLVRLLFKTCKPLLRANLLGDNPGQMLFAFYKLGYYTSLN